MCIRKEWFDFFNNIIFSFGVIPPKDTIYKIRNDVCFTGVNNHATFQYFKSTWGQSLYFEANMTIK